MTYPDIIVSGAGSTEVNGTYVWQEPPPELEGFTIYTLNGEPFDPENTTQKHVAWVSFYEIWMIGNLADPDGLLYYSAESVATPDLVETWTVNKGQPPVPTVEADAPAPPTEHHISIGTIGATANVGTVGVKQAHKIKPQGITATAGVGNIGVRQGHKIKPTAMSASANVGNVGVRQAHRIKPATVGATASVGDIGIKQAHVIKPATISATANVGDIAVRQMQEKTVTLTAIADAMIPVQVPNHNYGGYPALDTWASKQHILLRFDLSELPTDAEVIDAKLRLMSNLNIASAIDFAVYKIADANGDWNEGVGVVRLAEPGEVCWNWKAYPDVPWAGSAGLGTAGTDYDPSPVAGASVQSLSKYQVVDFDFTAYGKSVLASWCGTPTNSGLMLRATYDGTVQFYSKEQAADVRHPKLEVTYQTLYDPTHRIKIGNIGATANISEIGVHQAHRMRIDDISVLANIGDIGIRQAHKITIGDIEVVTVIEPISIRQAHKISIGTLQAEINVSDIKVRQLLIVPVPQARQYRVKPEHRVFAVMSDNRVYEIAHEDRTLVITQ